MVMAELAEGFSLRFDLQALVLKSHLHTQTVATIGLEYSLCAYWTTSGHIDIFR